MLLNLGNSITKKAMSNNLPIVIDIFAYGKQLFHFSTDATSQDNDRWVIRKRNTVLHFHHSSKYVNLKVKNNKVYCNLSTRLIEMTLLQLQEAFLSELRMQV